jgi:hypothetical protein
MNLIYFFQINVETLDIHPKTKFLLAFGVEKNLFDLKS